MALDTNIALGIRPIEQPNMLAQMGQMMQLRQAQQGYESENALRDFYAQNGDLSKAEDRRRLMSKAPVLGRQLISQQSETDARDIKTQTDSLKTIKDNISLANTPQAMAEYLRGAYSMPGGALLAKLVPLDMAIAKIPTDPKSFADYQRNFGLTSEKLLESADAQLGASSRIQAANISAGPANRRLDYDIANPAQYHFTGADGTLMTAPQRGSGGARPVPMAGFGAPPPPVTMGGGGGVTPMGGGSSIMVNPAPVNALAPSAPINQNALIAQLQPTPAPAAPTFAQVRAVPVTKAVLDPTDPAGKRMIEVDANTYVAGTGLGADGKGAPPKGVLGVAASQIPPNYMLDPNNPQGVIPVPGSPADPKAISPSGYRRTAKGDLEAIPGGPQDPKIIAAANTVKLSAKDAAAREAKYPQATAAIKSFDAKTDKFDRDITELLANEKGLNEITGFFSGRTDLSAISKEARRALALFNTITAKGGFSELQDMRNASPTGGALGNVSNQEGKQLIDSFAALSRTQSGDDVRKSLATAKSDLQNLKTRMREAYDLTYEYKTPADGGFTYLGREP